MSCRIATLKHLLTMPKGKWNDCGVVSQQIKASYASTDAALQALKKAQCVERERLTINLSDGSKRKVWHYRIVQDRTDQEILRMAGAIADKPRYQPMVTVSAALDALFAALDRSMREPHGA